MSHQITKSIIVQGDAADLFDLWADFENFPNFIKEIKSVEKIDEYTSHWVMEGPFGVTIEWDAETTRLEPNRRIAWSSKGDSGDITTSGQVTFTPLPQRETEVTVTLHYAPRTSLPHEIAVPLFNNTEERLLRDLRNFKAYAEGMAERII